MKLAQLWSIVDVEISQRLHLWKTVRFWPSSLTASDRPSSAKGFKGDHIRVLLPLHDLAYWWMNCCRTRKRNKNEKKKAIFLFDAEGSKGNILWEAERSVVICRDERGRYVRLCRLSRRVVSAISGARSVAYEVSMSAYFVMLMKVRQTGSSRHMVFTYSIVKYLTLRERHTTENDDSLMCGHPFCKLIDFFSGAI